MVKATISGLEMEFKHHIVTARTLMNKIHPLLGWGNVHYKVEKDRSYYLPRQNIPNGITGDGGYEFDLRECNDFIMVNVHVKRGWKGLNLYGCAGNE